MKNFYSPVSFYLILNLFYFLGIDKTYGQNPTEGVVIGKPSPHINSILDISSTDKGVLFPRMTTNQRQAITITPLDPPAGLLVYDTDESAYYFYKNGKWELLSDSTSSKIRAFKQIGIDSLYIYQGDDSLGLQLPVRYGTLQESNLSIRATDEGTFTGNVRGVNSVDLQTKRGSATQVASGDNSTLSGGTFNTASGTSSTVSGGNGNTASSYGEWVGGLYATIYSPNSATTFNNTDRLFVVGNGTSNTNRSNALTLLKSGNLGLGTSTPQQRLDLGGSAEAGLLRLGNVITTPSNSDSAKGSLAYDYTNNAPQYYDGTAWQAMGGGGGTLQESNLSIRATEEGIFPGNPRGANSVDLQTARIVFGQVASGESSTLVGGQNNTASGPYSTVSGGNFNTAFGTSSTVSGGAENTASSYGEWVGGLYATIYSPNSATAFNNTDRLFVVGNGTSNTNRSNALTLLKSGNLGLGTSTPQQRLDLGGSAEAGLLRLGNVITTPSNSDSAKGSLAYDYTNNAPQYYDGTAWQAMGGGGGGGTLQEETNLSIRATDEGTVIGNVRGVNSVDLQTKRDSATQVASGYISTLSGGNDNTASGQYSTLSGGNSNISSGQYSTLSGGNSNTSSGHYSTLSGGNSNTSSGHTSTLSGGENNTSSGSSSTLSGGNSNISSGYASTLSGGNFNTSSGTSSTLSGGYSNTSSGTSSTLSGGYSNISSGISSTLSGGDSNTSSGKYSTLSGGNSNISSEYASTLSGGNSNISSGQYSTLSGGNSNTSSGNSSTLSGGVLNTASGDFSTVSGGNGNTAYSFGEWVGGLYATIYSPNSATAFNNTDRLFVVGNGTATFNRSNALTLLKSGNLGLGTSTPQQRLDLGGSAEAGLLRLGNVITTPSNSDSAKGSLAYDYTNNAPQYYDGTAWQAMGGGGGGGTLQEETYLSIRATDEGTVIGNVRGVNSVDLQTIRGSATQVASGNNSTLSGGTFNTASGTSSTVSGGNGNTAYSYGEWVGGLYATIYSPNSATTFNNTDRLFVVGNGTSNTNRSNALTLLKSGNLGLGTSTPQQRLDLGGSAQAGLLRLGNVITTPSNSADAKGSLAYDYTNNIPQYYDGTAWQAMGGGGGTLQEETNLSIRATDEGTVIGSTRGVNSVDLQTKRGSATQVASGDNSTLSGGTFNTASGTSSTVSGGNGNTASSYGEWVGGLYATIYSPNSATTFNNTDRLFVVGNGTSNTNRSNALTLLKSGNLGLGTSTPQQRLDLGGSAQAGLLRLGNVITTPSNSADAKGSLAYDYTNNAPQYYDGTAWQKMGGGGTLQESNLSIRATDEGTVIGSTRGVNSVDLQTKRGSATQVASGTYSTLSGGGNNTASEYASTLSGGYSNAASGNFSTVSGGNSNTASGNASTVSGGNGNTAYSYGEWVGGLYATIYSPNSATTFNNTDRLFVVGNGTSTFNRSNALTLLKSGNLGLGTSTPQQRLDLGGSAQDGLLRLGNVITTPSNSDSAKGSLAYDYTNNAPQYYDGTAWQTLSNGTLQNPDSEDLSIRAKDEGGAFAGDARGTHSLDLQTYREAASQVAKGNYSTLSGGKSNTASGSNSTVSGGSSNLATGSHSTITGGGSDTASGGYSTVSGGYKNSASGDYSTVNGGWENTTKGRVSTVSGGKGNTAHSYGEWVGGLFTEDYAPSSITTYDSTDRLFVVGNGTSTSTRSNALTLLKNGNLGLGTSTPNDKAILELSSTTKGFMPPRMTQAQRDAITGLGVADEGLQIYNTDIKITQTWNGVAWTETHLFNKDADVNFWVVDNPADGEFFEDDFIILNLTATTYQLKKKSFNPLFTSDRVFYNEYRSNANNQPPTQSLNWNNIDTTNFRNISNDAPLRTGINTVDPLEFSKVDLSFRNNGLPLSYTIWSNNGLIEIKRTIAKTSSKILAGATDFTRKAAYLDLDASQANPSTGLLGGSWSSLPNFSNTIEQVGTLPQFELKKGISYKLTAEFSYLNVASGDECDFAFVDITNLGTRLGTTGGVDGGEHKRSRTARTLITPSEDMTVGIEILKSSGTYSILASQNNGGTSIMVEEL